MTQTMTVEELQAMADADDHEGRSIEDIAEDPEGIDDPEDTAVTIAGTHQQLSLAVGGRKPDSAAFKMKATEVKVRDGQYHKGETVELRVIARIDEIDFVDMHDEYGVVTATKRVHKAKPISVEKIESEEE